MAVSLASEMGIDDTMSLVVVILINIVACPASIFFGRLVGRFGSKKMIYSGIIGYTGVVLCGAMIKTYPSFIWAVALLVGLFQGWYSICIKKLFRKADS